MGVAKPLAGIVAGGVVTQARVAAAPDRPIGIVSCQPSALSHPVRDVPVLTHAARPRVLP